jgi:membrane-associated phospholipid phosphatase
MWCILLASAFATESPVTYDPWVDGGITVGALATLGALVLGRDKAFDPTGEISDPSPLDAWVSPRYKPTINRVSDGVFLGAALVTTGGTLWDSWTLEEPIMARTGVLFEAVTLNLLLTEGLKLSVRRPRPYTRMSPGQNDLVDAKMKSADSAMSFPSGHASATASFSFAAARMWQLAHPDSNKHWLLYTGATALCLGVAYMRVDTGAHYPTDVTAGLLIGVGVALSVVEWHRTDASKSTNLSVVPTSIRFQGLW